MIHCSGILFVVVAVVVGVVVIVVVVEVVVSFFSSELQFDSVDGSRSSGPVETVALASRPARCG